MQASSFLFQCGQVEKRREMATKTVGQRIAASRKAMGLSQPQLAEKCGWGPNQSRVSNYEMGRSQPSFEDLGKIAQILGVNAGYLAFGESSERDNWMVDAPAAKEEDSTLESVRPLPQSEEKGSLRVERYILDRAGVAPGAAFWFPLLDNSMEPFMPAGTAVVIDSNDRQIQSGKRYAVEYGGVLTIRLLYQLPKGVIRMKSHNDIDWQDEEIQPQDQHELRILGRVAWFLVMA